MIVSKYNLARLTFYLRIFIWSNGGPKIKMQQLTLSKAKGDLNSLVPELKLRALLTNQQQLYEH